MSEPGIQIMLVDDDEDDIFIFKRALKSVPAPVSVVTAFNGQEAINLLESSRPMKPDKIFLDINMPVMNGIDCLEWIKKSDFLKDVHVIVLTTSSYEKDIQKCINMGAEYWIKPHSVAALVEMLKKLLTAENGGSALS